ncbi:MAG: hypothetical protein IJC18_00255, partial [Clostridia bacterium]|nr:hypothetical protein [Clostridia bacterium]
ITPLGIDNLRFDFSDDISRITWHEDGVDNSTEFCTDGRYTSCKLSYGGNILDASVYGAWISEDTLELDIRIIKTPHMLRAIFKFDGDTVTYSFGEDPTLEDSMKTLISLVKFFRPLSSQLAKFAEKLITPELVGKLEQA